MKTILVQRIYKSIMEVDVEDFDPADVDLDGLALDNAKRDMQDIIDNDLDADDFDYKIIKREED